MHAVEGAGRELSALTAATEMTSSAAVKTDTLQQQGSWSNAPARCLAGKERIWELKPHQPAGRDPLSPARTPRAAQHWVARSAPAGCRAEGSIEAQRLWPPAGKTTRLHSSFLESQEGKLKL